MEFNIIKQYFTWSSNDKSIIIAGGDDCAIINNQAQLAISTDTLISGVHFFANTPASEIAYKSLAVNLSDLASMGATPKYFNLALTLPDYNKTWLQEFSTSLKNLATKFNLSLIGGDTTKGHLSITISIFGECNSPILRSGAQVGDAIFVSGNLGGAKLALEQIKNNKKINQLALEKLQRPIPQIKLGQELTKVANSCIDISDGLVSDLNHILQQSKVGASIDSNKIPIFTGSNLEYALFGGDDYELCWTANINKINQKKLSQLKSINNITQIGVITKELGLKIDNQVVDKKGYLHF